MSDSRKHRMTVWMTDNDYEYWRNEAWHERLTISGLANNMLAHARMEREQQKQLKQQQQLNQQQIQRNLPPQSISLPRSGYAGMR